MLKFTAALESEAPQIPPLPVQAVDASLTLKWLSVLSIWLRRSAAPRQQGIQHGLKKSCISGAKGGSQVVGKE